MEVQTKKSRVPLTLTSNASFKKPPARDSDFRQFDLFMSTFSNTPKHGPDLAFSPDLVWALRDPPRGGAQGATLASTFNPPNSRS